MKVGRIPYINCYPVYGAIDRGIASLAAELVDGVPTALNRQMASGALDVSVVSAVEYARNADRYLLVPNLAISCDGPVRSVALFSKRPASELDGRPVIVSRSSMTSAALVELLFEHVWHAQPHFVPGDAELSDLLDLDRDPHDARLVIGDAALLLTARRGAHERMSYRYVYDLGAEWKAWTGLPFVFAVWAAQRTSARDQALAACAALRASRDWGLDHLPDLARQAADVTGVAAATCLDYLSGLDYGLSYAHLAGLIEFLRRLVVAGRVPDGSLAFLPAA